MFKNPNSPYCGICDTGGGCFGYCASIMPGSCAWYGGGDG